jgi:hypothetical protein
MEKTAADMCSLSCVNICSRTSSGPVSNECAALANYLQNRGKFNFKVGVLCSLVHVRGSFAVGPGSSITATSRSCTTTFSNIQAHGVMHHGYVHFFIHLFGTILIIK